MMVVGFALLPAALAAMEMSASSPALDVQRQYAQWESKLRARVADLHLVSADALKDAPCDVVIGFAIGKDGRPADIALRQSSCGRGYERRAEQLVRELGRVGPVPSLSTRPHPVTLKLSYGRAADGATDRNLSQALDSERQQATRRNLEIVTQPGG